MTPAIVASHSGTGVLWSMLIPLCAVLLAGLSIWTALVIALRKTDVSALRQE